MPSLAGFNVVGTSTSSQISIINGATTSQVVYLYQLQPYETGELIIEPITLTLGGQTYSTQPIAVQVSQGSSAPAPAIDCPVERPAGGHLRRADRAGPVRRGTGGQPGALRRGAGDLYLSLLQGAGFCGTNPSTRHRRLLASGASPSRTSRITGSRQAGASTGSPSCAPSCSLRWSARSPSTRQGS